MRSQSILGKDKQKADLIEAAGHEIKTNPPKILKKTANKSGAKRMKKQKVAIMLSKARKAGAKV